MPSIAPPHPGQYGGEMKGSDSRQSAQNIPGMPSNGGFPQIGQRNGIATERHEVNMASRRFGMGMPQRFFE
jgi:hypothetical protein